MMELEEAIKVVARAEIVAHLGWALSSGVVDHEQCPDIGENDWEAVTAKMHELVRVLTPERELASRAYEMLIERAERWAGSGGVA